MSVELWIALGAGAGLVAVLIGVALLVVARRRRALPVAETDLIAEPAEPPRDTVLARLRVGLAKTKGQLVRRIDELFADGRIDADQLARLEEILIAADVGVRTTARMLDELRASLKGEEATEPTFVRTWLRDRMARIVSGSEAPIAGQPDDGPLVIMVVGVNGSGKTTTIGKLASRYTRAGDKVMLAAADTFRAAASEQLEIWGDRADAEVVRREEGADPASVAHDAMSAALARGCDVLICDTAGRLHTKVPLMDELGKVKRVLGKQMATAPHEVLLVIDANTGQNAIAQARSFSQAVDITGIVLTKLDGTAKGGVIVGICDELGIPVKLIGIGEQVDDLRDFVAEDFIEALFEQPDDLDSPPAPQ